MESEVSKLMKIERQMEAAYSTDFMLLTQIAPYLKQRQEAAKVYFQSHLSDLEKKNCVEAVSYYNDCIKKVMGL